MKLPIKLAAAILPVLALADETALANRRALTLAGAKQVAAAAVAEAKRLNAPGAVVAVVDEGGHLIYLERLDGTFAAGATVATGKARASAVFQKPTKVFEDAVKAGRTGFVAVPEMPPLKGGFPIVAGGQVVGAVGVSGAASADQDEEIAKAAAAALQ